MGRPCLRLSVVGRSHGEEVLTLLLDTWSPGLHTMILFPWAADKVSFAASGLPGDVAGHNRFEQPLDAGYVQVARLPWRPLGGHYRAALLERPIGGPTVNGRNVLEGIIDGYATAGLFQNLRVIIDYASSTVEFS